MMHALRNIAATWGLLSVLGSFGSGCQEEQPITSLPDKLEEGMILSINPEIRVLSGGRFAYENSDADSAFTAEIDDGTYTYELRGGVATLVLKGDASEPDKLLGKLPETLTLAQDGDGIAVEIDGEVIEGTLRAAAP